MSLLNPDDPFNPTTPRLSSETQRVIVTDIDMTIGDMCRFMVKWAIAAIPAVVILYVLWFVLGAITVAMLEIDHGSHRSRTIQLTPPPPPPPADTVPLR